MGVIRAWLLECREVATAAVAAPVAAGLAAEAPSGECDRGPLHDGHTPVIIASVTTQPSSSGGTRTSRPASQRARLRGGEAASMSWRIWARPGSRPGEPGGNRSGCGCGA